MDNEGFRHAIGHGVDPLILIGRRGKWGTKWSVGLGRLSQPLGSFSQIGIGYLTARQLYNDPRKLHGGLGNAMAQFIDVSTVAAQLCRQSVIGPPLKEHPFA